MKPYWKVTFWYALFGAAWIFFSDQAAGALFPNVHSLIFVQTIKGWLFVALSALLIFHLVRKAWRNHLALERDKREVFRKTVEGARHILLNYLNQMQLVTMEADRCRDFDPKLLKLAEEISDAAAAALRRLEAAERLSAKEIHQIVHGRDGTGS